MKSNLAMVRQGALLGVAAIALVPSCAWAQDTGAVGTPSSTTAVQDTPTDDSTDQERDIIVTGTLVRGIAPPGANVLAVSDADIKAIGATSVARVLETIPQLGSFGSLQIPQAISPEVTVNRPNLRNLPGFNTAGGSTTLVLLDGHRIVGMGITSTTPDPDVLPPGILERVEIVPDGGSAIYGSDAVAGVLNFVTIKRFDGVKVDGSYGFAKDYYRYAGNITAGRDWGSGSLFASYNYSRSDELLGRDRDYIRQFPGASGYTSLECSPGNIQALAGAFAPAGTVRNVSGGTPNQCDVSDTATVFPSSKRHSVFAGLTQELSPSINFELRGFYTNRQTHLNVGPYRDTQIISPFPIPGVPSIQSPFTQSTFVPVPPFFLPAGPTYLDLVQNVSYQFGADDAVQSDIRLSTWGITPTVTADLGSNFQLRVLGSYGESDTRFVKSSLNQAALRNAITAGLFNPYNPSASNPTAIAAVTNFEEYNRTRQYFHDLRAIIDGDLFTLPGGAIKIAAGLEYSHEEFRSQRGGAIPGFENTGFPGQSIGATLVVPAQVAAPRFTLDRSMKSAFGELVVPIFGSSNATGGLYSLTVSAAARYDDYNDFGDTFNPKFGLTYKPIEWISIRGAYGKSFNAPSLADDARASENTLFVLSGASASFFYPPASLQQPNGPYPAPGGLIVAQRGNAPGIQPQKATTWSAGFDIKPPFIPGLTFGATYYNISFKKFIGLPPFESPEILYRDFPNVITIGPSQAVLDAAVASSPNAVGLPRPLAAGTYAFLDARKRNLGDFKLDGIDFTASYQMPTSFGSINLGTAGTYELSRERSNTQGSPFLDVLSANNSRFRVRSTLGAAIGSFLAQATWSHLAGYKLDPVVGFVPQNRVKSFNTVDLFFSYDLKGSGALADLAITANIDNLLDQDPPEFRGGSQIAGTAGIANGATIGRFFQFGISKKF